MLQIDLLCSKRQFTIIAAGVSGPRVNWARKDDVSFTRYREERRDTATPSFSRAPAHPTHFVKTVFQ